MRFLLRAAFWFGLVMLLLPVVRSSNSDGRQAAPVGAVDAASAATATLSDMSRFCTRKPDACAIGAQVAAAAGQQAQAGAKLLYELLSEKLASESAGAVRGADAGRSEAAYAGKGARDTLTDRDLAPDWRGPGKGKDAPHKRALNES